MRQEANRRWRLAHPDYLKVWRQANAGRVKFYRMAWKARKRFEEVVHWSVFARIAQLPCVTCGVEPAGGVDHIVSKPMGGRNIMENLQAMCYSDNVRKGR